MTPAPLSDVAGTTAGVQAEILAQLKAARQWLKMLIDELDLEPDDTAFVVNVVGPTGEREAARVTLAHSLTQIDTAITAADEAASRPTTGDPT